MSRTTGLYRDDQPQYYRGILNYHSDDNLPTGGFTAIWVIYQFVGFCFTTVLAVVIKRSLKGKTPGPGVQLIIFNIAADASMYLSNMFFQIIAGGDLSIFSPGMVAIYCFMVHLLGFLQINSVMAMFHLRRKMMQDITGLNKDRAHAGMKYIKIAVAMSVITQIIYVFGMTPNWTFNMKWYVNGDVDSDADRVLVTATINASGHDNVLYNVIGMIEILLALPLPMFYCLYCLFPVLKLLNKFRKQGICSSEMESLARLSITFYLIFVVFTMFVIVVGVLQQNNVSAGNRGRGFTWVVPGTLILASPAANTIACYVFFPRFRAYGLALFYDIIGKKDLARERETLVEKEIEDYNQTMTKGATEGQTTAQTDTAQDTAV